MKNQTQFAYPHYPSGRKKTAIEVQHRYERVKKLLNKLPESERTVMTLYYLGEMTTKEISKLLGVSINKVTRRLQRAQRCLHREEEHFIKEVLGDFQLSAYLTQDIMRKVSDIDPIPPQKTFLPYVALGAVISLIALLFGTINKYIAGFLKFCRFNTN